MKGLFHCLRCLSCCQNQLKDSEVGANPTGGVVQGVM